jgi:hypothetical protein
MQYSHEATPSPHWNWVPSRHQRELVGAIDQGSQQDRLCFSLLSSRPLCACLTSHWSHAASAKGRICPHSRANFIGSLVGNRHRAQCQAAKNPDAHDSPAPAHAHANVHTSCTVLVHNRSPLTNAPTSHTSPLLSGRHGAVVGASNISQRSGEFQLL